MTTHQSIAIWRALDTPGSMADVMTRSGVSQTACYCWLRRMVRDNLLDRERNGGTWAYARAEFRQEYDVERTYNGQEPDLHVPAVWARDVFEFAARVAAA